MEEYCVNCGASLFSPQATICVKCEQNPHYKETELGRLSRIWIYDRVALPIICISCGSSDDLEGLSMSFSAEEKKIPFIFVVLGWLLPGIWRVIFLPRIIDKASEPEMGRIESELQQCGSCMQSIKIEPIQVDNKNRRFQVIACQKFIDAANGS